MRMRWAARSSPTTSPSSSSPPQRAEAWRVLRRAARAGIPSLSGTPHAIDRGTATLGVRVPRGATSAGHQGVPARRRTNAVRAFYPRADAPKNAGGLRFYRWRSAVVLT
jgi:hypothetical protein